LGANVQIEDMGAYSMRIRFYCLIALAIMSLLAVPALFGAIARAAPAPTACTLRGGFQFKCFGKVITPSLNPILLGGMLTLTVDPTSGYSFDAKTVIVLEPVKGVGFGVGLRTLCGGLVGGAAALPCPVMGSKSMTLAIPGSGSIPVGSYVLTAENWETAIVVGSVGICTPTCTEATAGIVRFSSTPMSTLQITGVSYPGPSNQIAVAFDDPAKDINKVQVQPWTGYQWGPPSSWNPHASGMVAGTLFIATGCHIGQNYTILITLFGASGQSAQQKFSYICI
jgi:hypothetical protein